MRLELETLVNLSKDQVKERFDEKLFRALSPPFMKLKIKEFGGCKKGDRVHIELLTPIFKGSWISDITDDWDNDEEWVFIDEGSQMPPPLKTWKHQHIVKAKGEKSVIIDRIDFTCANKAIELGMYPGLLASFLYRKPIYKKLLR